MWVQKNYCWIWIAVDRLGKRFVGFVSGDRSTQTGLKLWEEIKDIPVSFYCSDYWESYQAFIPKEKHLQTKAETFTVEGYNSRIRHYLARFKRKGKCYSKAQHMIDNQIDKIFYYIFNFHFPNYQYIKNNNVLRIDKFIFAQI
jgi:insertion element IS1 protein InsB